MASSDRLFLKHAIPRSACCSIVYRLYGVYGYHVLVHQLAYALQPTPLVFRARFRFVRKNVPTTIFGKVACTRVDI